MKPPDDRQRIDLLTDADLENLIHEALEEMVSTAEPSPRAWALIRAEIEADRVPIWVAWWRRGQLAFSGTLPRLIPNAIIVALFLLLGGVGLRGYGWLDDMTASSDFVSSDRRQIVVAERRFYDQYRVAYTLVPVDAPPKGIRREPRVSIPSTGPKHLAVGAMDPS